MSKIIDWLKEHASLYATVVDDEGDFSQVGGDSHESTEDIIEDELKKTEIGIKFTWKW